MDLSCAKFDENSARLLVDILQNDRVLEELILYGCDLNDQTLANIFQALCGNKTLKRLNVEYSPLGPLSGKAAAAMLRENFCLQSLELDLGELLPQEGFRSIVEAMKTNRSVTELELNCSSVDKNDMMLVSEMVQANPRLTSLSVPTYSKCDKACEALANSLAGNRSLQKLKWPNMTSEMEQRCIDILMAGNGSLLDCSISDKGETLWEKFKDRDNRHEFEDLCA